jgi:hypothetical protein
MPITGSPIRIATIIDDLQFREAASFGCAGALSPSAIPIGACRYRLEREAERLDEWMVGEHHPGGSPLIRAGGIASS